ncbi:MAG: nucleoside-triphosphatase [Thermoproteota archaeon]|nr:nucleoside-triphosphatase [Thermoproteota archaeon]
MKIFLIGVTSIGKTTVVKNMMTNLRERGLVAGGIICPEIRLGNIRLGFKIVDLISGKRGILSHISQLVCPKISKYVVNLQDLSEVGVEAINRALNEADYVIIDEVGPMEPSGKISKRQ